MPYILFNNIVFSLGFRLSATVEEERYHVGRSSNNSYVTIYFDRGKITNAYCSGCSQKSWCRHVIAVVFKRIASKQDPTKVKIHPPVSDSLNLLTRGQLLKFAQYLLCEHKNEPVVESAEELLNELLGRGGGAEHGDNAIDINAVDGAPDPTAGPGKVSACH